MGRSWKIAIAVAGVTSALLVGLGLGLEPALEALAPEWTTGQRLGLAGMDAEDVWGRKVVLGPVSSPSTHHGGPPRLVLAHGYHAPRREINARKRSTTDPGDWQTGTGILEVVSTSDNGDGTETVTVRIRQTIAADPDGKEFMRVYVELIE